MFADIQDDNKQILLRTEIVAMLDSFKARGITIDFDKLINSIATQYGENSLELEELINILEDYATD
jgi:hypothetical protein